MTSRQPVLRRKETFKSDYHESRRGSDSSNSSHSTDSSAVTTLCSEPSSYDVRGSCDSVDTYCSTVASEEDLDPQFVAQGAHYERGYSYYAPPPSGAEPATPPVFADLFPSSRRLTIKHDDSCIDGNMNLRIDCNSAHPGDPERPVTLFYLRVHDLRGREMSLRRYGRDCGREVAKIKRKFAKKPSSTQRPTLQRSVSKAMDTFRSPKSSKALSINRTDSGYGSSFDEDSDEDVPEEKTPAGVAVATNTMVMEFSNYAHVGLKRRGGQGNKKYEFEYWGTKYAWKRTSKKTSVGEEISYNLVNMATNVIVAHIVPENLSSDAARAESERGGFVPPSSLFIEHQRIDRGLCDVADVIVATGLAALVDDSIKRKFSKNRRVVQMVIPLTPIRMNMEYIGPKKLVDELFNRRNSQSGRPGAPSRSASYSGNKSEQTRPGLFSRETSYASPRPSLLSRESSYSSRRTPVRGVA